MKSYDKKQSYIMYSDGNNLYGWVMSQKLPINNSKLYKNVKTWWKVQKKLWSI